MRGSFHVCGLRYRNIIAFRAPGAPPGRHNLLFKVVFGSDGAAARHYRTTRMTVWRWRHDKSPLPRSVSDDLASLVQKKVEEAHQAQNELRYYLAEPPPPPRKLSGCCSPYARKPEKRW
jgi:hypothetical protein